MREDDRRDHRTAIVAGGPWEDSDGSSPRDQSQSDAGAVWVWRRTGTTWIETAYLESFNAETNDNFGDAVASAARSS